MAYEATIKLGTNRGVPRLWLEGKKLSTNGWTRGVTFFADLSDEGLTIHMDAKGDRRVSGKGDHPIIDVAGEWLRALADRPLALTIEPSRILVGVL